MKHLIFILSYPMSPGVILISLILFNITISQTPRLVHTLFDNLPFHISTKFLLQRLKSD